MDTERSRWVALYVLCTGMLMIVLDISIVNVALPYIQSDLGFSKAGLAWVVNAYLIAFAGLLLLSGRLGDLLGRRRVLVVGLAIFTVASLLCGAAQTEWQLIAARFVQGVGGALASAVILGMIVTLFPEPGEQAKALGVYGFVASSGGAIGGLAGGVLTQLISWHWIFLVNIPIGIVTMWLVVRTVPDDEGLGLDNGADVPGAVLITTSLMLGVYATVASVPWAAVPAVLLLAAFVWRQATASNPLMPLSLFRSRITVGANVVQMLTVAGMFGMFFLVTLYVQGVLGWSALEIGVGFLPVSIVMCVMSLSVSDRLVARFGAQPTLLAGTLVAAVGLGLFVLAPVDGSYWVHVLPGMTLLGLGMGGAFPAMMAVAMSDVPPEDAGIASGLVGTSAEAGAALGLAVLATLAANRTDRLIRGGVGTKEALTSGYHLAFAVGTGLLVLAALICATVLRTVDVHGQDASAQELESAAA
ncbi:MAG: drug resistance transporter, EmrB/QacA subfamily [Frankiales bacterium]|nr:drug resistance transporter, EmrB/QacA subfamily [Frankiales bacterium]